MRKIYQHDGILWQVLLLFIFVFVLGGSWCWRLDERTELQVFQKRGFMRFLWAYIPGKLRLWFAKIRGGIDCCHHKVVVRYWYQQYDKNSKSNELQGVMKKGSGGCWDLFSNTKSKVISKLWQGLVICKVIIYTKLTDLYISRCANPMIPKNALPRLIQCLLYCKSSDSCTVSHWISTILTAK